jgi:hypothetical protein
MTSRAFNAALDAVSNMEAVGGHKGASTVPRIKESPLATVHQKAWRQYQIRPRGTTFEGYPHLSLRLLFENGGIIACPRNDWLRRWLRRS